MLVFQIISQHALSVAPPRKSLHYRSSRWYTILRAFAGSLIGGILFSTLLITLGQSDKLFVLLPIFVSLAWAQPHRYNLSQFLNSTPIYLVLTIALTCFYYGVTITFILLVHQSQTSRIILIATTLSWTIVFDPVRAYCQRLLEQRFNVRDREVHAAIEQFTKTLREEIHLDQLRERFLAVIQQTLQPYAYSLWIPLSSERQNQAAELETIPATDDDPLVLYLLTHPGVSAINRLPQFNSPLLREIQARIAAAEILLPLASQGELTGLLILGLHLKGEVYTHEERTLLNTLALQVAPAWHVASMVQEQQEQALARERIEQELQTAQVIQRAFLPKETPMLPGWLLLPYYQPAREVGGDFYDFLSFADGRMGLVIGDVTGKGVPAALVMVMVHTMLRAVVQETIAPGEVLARVNELLAQEIPAGMFVTCFFLLLDPASGKLRYANAGHELPYHQHAGGVNELWATGMPLGMLPGNTYDEYEASLAPGESLFFYSDGLIEAHNAQREMYDNPRLGKLLSTLNTDDSLIDNVLRSLRGFTGEQWEQEDDVTLVMVRRLSKPGTLRPVFRQIIAEA